MPMPCTIGEVMGGQLGISVVPDVQLRKLLNLKKRNQGRLTQRRTLFKTSP
jgi:hypothetical protein